MVLVCPASTRAAVRAAVAAGAHAVRWDLDPGSTAAEFEGAVADAHAGGGKLVAARDGFARAGALDAWRDAVDAAAEAGADALLLADMGLLDHAARHHPRLARHLAARAGAATPEAIRFYAESWGVKRVVLPRALTAEEISTLRREGRVALEVTIDDAAGTAGASEADALAADPTRPAGGALLWRLQAAGVDALALAGPPRNEVALGRVVRTFAAAVAALARGKSPEAVARLAAAAQGAAEGAAQAAEEGAAP
jgi:collagenase-like PrtC family protease